MKCKQMCHFQVEAFIACLCFDILFSLSQSNQSLFLSLILSLAHSVSCCYSFYLLATRIHASDVSLYTSALFFLLTYPPTCGPALPASSKWQPWTPNQVTRFPEKKSKLPKLEASFQPWIIQLCLGAQGHMWSRLLTLYYRQGDRYTEMMEISSIPVQVSRLLNKK